MMQLEIINLICFEKWIQKMNHYKKEDDFSSYLSSSSLIILEAILFTQI